MIRALGISLAFLALAGCVADPQQHGGTPTTTTQVASTPDIDKTPEDAADAAEKKVAAIKPATIKPATIKPAAIKPATEKPARAIPAPLPGTLIGLTAPQLTVLMGAPDFRRRDKPAELWQYTNGDCTLDLFLYQAGTDTPFRVTHLEARDAGAGTLAAKVCFENLWTERRNAGRG